MTLSIRSPHSDEAFGYGTEPCPECRKRGQDTRGDNLVCFSDGHRYCFACKYYVPKNKRKANRQALEELLNVSEEHMNVKTIKLPEDASFSIDFKAVSWLALYGIKNTEVHDNRLMWSEKKQLLIFPFYGATEHELLAWQGRNFKEGFARYHTQGMVENVFHYHKLSRAKQGVIIVEDCVSAIKVGRYACTLPLLGSNFSAERRMRMKHTTDHLIFWLDYDKVDVAYRYAKECKLLGYKTQVIVTHDDPKVHTDDEIQDILEGINY